MAVDVKCLQKAASISPSPNMREECVRRWRGRRARLSHVLKTFQRQSLGLSSMESVRFKKQTRAQRRRARSSVEAIGRMCEPFNSDAGLSESRKVTNLSFPSTLHQPLSEWRHNAIFTYESTAKQIAYTVCPLHKHSVSNDRGSWTHLLFLNVPLLTGEH